MNERDMQMIIRIQKHTEAILRYTQDCGGKDFFIRPDAYGRLRF